MGGEVMKGSWPRNFGIVGTDTEIGKTLVAAILVKGLGASYWKPVQAGLESPTDSDWVRHLADLPLERVLPEAYRIRAAVSPHLGSQLEGIRVDPFSLCLPKVNTPLVVEGAGGVLTPLNGKDVMADLFKHLDLPVVLVARSTLGTINHTTLALEALRARAIPVLGVVMSGPLNPYNREAIRHFGQTEVLAEVDQLGTVSPTSIEAAFEYCFLDRVGV